MIETLFINACARENSRTKELANHLLNKLSSAVEEVKLYDLKLSPVDENIINLRDEAAKNKDFSNEIFFLAKQFANASRIVVAAPYWDLSFPSVVKSYFEAVTVNGITFAYGENGIPKGLCKAKSLIYVTTSGGPIIHNMGYEYVATIAKAFYGINDVKCISAEGLDIYGANVEEILKQAKKSAKF